MGEWLARIPAVDRALVVAVAVAAFASLVLRRRGGRHRELPGWAGFWGVFAALLIALARLPAFVSFPLLGGLMFAALRSYFSVARVRRTDRWAVLASYAAVPFALWPAFLGSSGLFLATVPVSLFLFIPVFLTLGETEQGMIDAMGRTSLGVLLFIFCLAHVALLVHHTPAGLPALFGVLVIAAELPQRLGGRFRKGERWYRPAAGVAASLALAVALGHLIGPSAGLVDDDAARAGLLVALAVTMGASIADAAARDLELTTPAQRLGRGALLNRMVPAVYAAPVFYHYINFFA